MEEHLMKIGEIAAFFNVSVKAVRIYEKKGIIRPARIDKQTGYRYYTADQVQQLNALIELKGLGFSLNEIDLCCSCIWYARIDGNSYGYQFLQGE